MSAWTLLEYAAWAVSALLGLLIVLDWVRTDSRYSEEELTSSREGELEALTEERSHG